MNALGDQDFMKELPVIASKKAKSAQKRNLRRNLSQLRKHSLRKALQHRISSTKGGEEILGNRQRLSGTISSIANIVKQESKPIDLLFMA